MEIREQPQVPLSVGDLIDKWVILWIKIYRIGDKGKLENIRREYDALTPIIKNMKHRYLKGATDEAKYRDLVEALKEVNKNLWGIEDELRKLEKAGIPRMLHAALKHGELSFLPHECDREQAATYVELARSVYLTNDRRAAVKRQLNELFGSSLMEEKSYEEY